jgi:hypothetical protein
VKLKTLEIIQPIQQLFSLAELDYSVVIWVIQQQISCFSNYSALGFSANSANLVKIQLIQPLLC